MGQVKGSLELFCFSCDPSKLSASMTNCSHLTPARKQKLTKSTTCMLPHYLVEIEANGNEYTRNKWRVQTAFCERVFVWQDNIAAGGCSRMARLAKLPSRSLRPRSFIHLSQSDLKVEQIVTVSGNTYTTPEQGARFMTPCNRRVK